MADRIRVTYTEAELRFVIRGLEELMQKPIMMPFAVAHCRQLRDRMKERLESHQRSHHTTGKEN